MFLFIYMILFIRFDFNFFILYINYLILDFILNKPIYREWKSGMLTIFLFKIDICIKTFQLVYLFYLFYI